MSNKFDFQKATQRSRGNTERYRQNGEIYDSHRARIKFNTEQKAIRKKWAAEKEEIRQKKAASNDSPPTKQLRLWEDGTCVSDIRWADSKLDNNK